MLWLLAARRKKLRHPQLLLLLKLRPLLLRLLMQSRLMPLLLLTLPSRLTPLLRLLTLPSLLTLLRPLMQSRLKLRPSNLRIIFGKKPVARPVFFRPGFFLPLPFPSFLHAPAPALRMAPSTGFLIWRKRIRTRQKRINASSP